MKGMFMQAHVDPLTAMLGRTIGKLSTVTSLYSSNGYRHSGGKLRVGYDQSDRLSLKRSGYGLIAAVECRAIS